jgi:hypothetical protein
MPSRKSNRRTGARARFSQEMSRSGGGGATSRANRLRRAVMS